MARSQFLAVSTFPDTSLLDSNRGHWLRPYMLIPTLVARWKSTCVAAFAGIRFFAWKRLFAFQSTAAGAVVAAVPWR